MMISGIMSSCKLLLSRLLAEGIVVLGLKPVLKVLCVVEIRLRGFQVVILPLKLHTLELVVVETNIQRVRCVALPLGVLLS
jgi:hypothetical protein